MAFRKDTITRLADQVGCTVEFTGPWSVIKRDTGEVFRKHGRARTYRFLYQMKKGQEKGIPIL